MFGAWIQKFTAVMAAITETDKTTKEHLARLFGTVVPRENAIGNQNKGEGNSKSTGLAIG